MTEAFSFLGSCNRIADFFCSPVCFFNGIDIPRIFKYVCLPAKGFYGYLRLYIKYAALRKLPDEIGQWVRELMQSDSQEAFKSLYIAYYQHLMRFVTPYIPNLQEAEEVISDTFLALWENRKALSEVSNFEAYLYTIARNKAVSQLRMMRTEDYSPEEAVDSFLYTETTPETELISKEGIERLNSAINALPEKCKLTFQLVREEKMKYKDVAQILNVSVKTVEAHITTAVRKLRDALSEIK